jgi:hypothetical protein
MEQILHEIMSELATRDVKIPTASDLHLKKYPQRNPTPPSSYFNSADSGFKSIDPNLPTLRPGLPSCALIDGDQNANPTDVRTSIQSKSPKLPPLGGG